MDVEHAAATFEIPDDKRSIADGFAVDHDFAGTHGDRFSYIRISDGDAPNTNGLIQNCRSVNGYRDNGLADCAVGLYAGGAQGGADSVGRQREG